MKGFTNWLKTLLVSHVNASNMMKAIYERIYCKQSFKPPKVESTLVPFQFFLFHYKILKEKGVMIDDSDIVYNDLQRNEETTLCLSCH